MGGPFRREIRGEGFGVRDAGEVGAFEDVLVVGFAGEEEGGGFGIDGGCQRRKGSVGARVRCKGGFVLTAFGE